MINNKNMQYYDTSKYNKANLLFEKFINSCEIEKVHKKSFRDFKISTITCVSTIATDVNIKRLCQYLNVEPKNDIVYIESQDLVKGFKKRKKIKPKNAKKVKKKGKNQLFSNQMSIGIKCHNKNHVHNNPVSIKVFKNGRIQMTGCKDMEEIEIMYKTLYNNMRNVKEEFYLNDQKFCIPTVENIIPFNKKNIKIEMINGTFYVNANLDLNKVIDVFQSQYSHEEVFIVKNKKSPLNFSIKLFGYLDKNKKKNKIPSVFIYNTGSINIIATSHDILEKTYQFIKTNIEENYDNIIEKKLKFNNNFFLHYPKLSKLSYTELCNYNSALI